MNLEHGYFESRRRRHQKGRVMFYIWIGAAFLAGFIAFPVTLFALRDVLPPTMFTPSDW